MRVRLLLSVVDGYRAIWGVVGREKERPEDFQTTRGGAFHYLFSKADKPAGDCTTISTPLTIDRLVRPSRRWRSKGVVWWWLEMVKSGIKIR